MTTLASLVRAVCERPGDDFRRLVLADALDDAGRPAEAAAWRWLGARGKSPRRCNPGVGWLWTTGHGSHSCLHGLPLPVFCLLTGARDAYFFGDPTKSRCHGRAYYHTARGAFGAAARAVVKARADLAG